jgi:hypothetical protein
MGSPVDPLSLHRYLYAEADPVTLIDPTGHYAVYNDGDVCPSCDPQGPTVASPPASGVLGRKTISRPNPPVRSKAASNATARARPAALVRLTPHQRDWSGYRSVDPTWPATRQATFSSPGPFDPVGTCSGGLVSYTGCAGPPDTSAAHLALDAVGTIDPTGAVDAVNAAIYALEGRLDDAAISAIAATVPYLGDAAKAARLARHADELVNLADRARLGVNSQPQRLAGPWTDRDLWLGLQGRPPRSLGNPDLHHADQMPCSGVHEVLPAEHRGNRALHPSAWNQGVTDAMRTEGRQLHWWYRAQEMGAWDRFRPGEIFDNWPDT